VDPTVADIAVDEFERIYRTPTARLAFLASARAFQEGEAVPVIACTSTAANLTCIVGGILVFGDALAGGALLIVLQVLAFALVSAAALLTPAGHGGRATA
jgi:hypothetical protein